MTPPKYLLPDPAEGDFLQSSLVGLDGSSSGALSSSDIISFVSEIRAHRYYGGMEQKKLTALIKLAIQ